MESCWSVNDWNIYFMYFDVTILYVFFLFDIISILQILRTFSYRKKMYTTICRSNEKSDYENIHKLE